MVAAAAAAGMCGSPRQAHFYLQMLEEGEGDEEVVAVPRVKENAG
jgi:uncharacterized protein YciW